MSYLSVRQVTKRFGGLLANDDVTFDLEKGEILGLIGPNGAGKSTLFNCVAGYLPPSSGRIVFEGATISGLPPEQICRRGIARTFQIARVFREMTVLENVMVGAFLREAGRREAERVARGVLGRVGLSARGGDAAGSLTVADQKRLQLARALATRPGLLLLDEAVSGLNPQETREAVALIRSFRSEGITMIIVEHVMEVIMPISDRVVVLDYGKKIAEGDPREIARDPRVVAAYLGERRGASR